MPEPWQLDDALLIQTSPHSTCGHEQIRSACTALSCLHLQSPPRIHHCLSHHQPPWQLPGEAILPSSWEMTQASLLLPTLVPALRSSTSPPLEVLPESPAVLRATSLPPDVYQLSGVPWMETGTFQAGTQNSSQPTCLAFPPPFLGKTGHTHDSDKLTCSPFPGMF